MIIICVLMAYLSIFLSVPLLLALVKIKQKKDCMNEKKWNDYFLNLSVNNYKKKAIMFIGFPLILSSFVNYFCLCRKYKKKQAAFISSLIFIFFAVRRAVLLNSNEINDIVWKIKNDCMGLYEGD